MFWNEKAEYWEVFPEWTEERVKEVCGGIGLADDSYENRWALFGNALGVSNGLNIFEATSMASIISGFMAGIPVSAGTDSYFNEDKIDGVVLDFFNELDHAADEIENRRKLVEFILELYKNHISEYAYKTKNLVFRVSPYVVDLFDNIPGETRANKFNTLLNSWYSE